MAKLSAPEDVFCGLTQGLGFNNTQNVRINKAVLFNMIYLLSIAIVNTHPVNAHSH